jgi:hypothetical protein
MKDFQVIQEKDELGRGPILATILVALLVGVAAVLVEAFLLHGMSGTVRAGAPPGGAAPRVAPAKIGLLEQTLVDREDMGGRVREMQEKQLESYRWIDRDAGIAQIPIERAMEIVAHEEAREASRE